jgi:Inhibitor of vertebrate lysozyme (Ivy)
MLARLLLVLLLALGSASAVVAEDAKGPVLGDLMKLPQYRAAWIGMLAGETPPAWIEDFAKTLDGPPSPSIPIPIGDSVYTLGFTCKPGGCGDEQLYVLFSPSGAKAWGLLLAAKQKKWFGSPDQSVQDAVLGALE